MKAGILWELLGVSRRVGSMHPLQIVEQRLTDEMSAGHSSLIVWYPRLGHMLTPEDPFVPRSLWDPSLPGFLLWVNVTSVLMTICWLCDQKTLLTHSFGLQINSSSEKPGRKTLFREKSWYLKSGGRALPFDLWAAQDSNAQSSEVSWAIEWAPHLVSFQQDEMTSIKQIGAVSMLPEDQAVSRKASH